jgi:hypothetical protein
VGRRTIGRLLVTTVICAALTAEPTGASASVHELAPLEIGDVRLSLYPVGTLLVEMPVGNPTGRLQTFQFRLLLLGSDGAVVREHLTEVVRLRSGAVESMRFVIPNADGVAAVGGLEAGLFGRPSDAPPDLFHPPPSL